MLTLEGSLLTSKTVSGPGAGAGRLNETGTVWPIVSVAPASRLMGPAFATVTLAVVSAILGAALAWIVVEPGFTPVTGTVTVVVLGRKVTLAGTAAIVVSSELRLMVKPSAGAGPDSVSVRFCTAEPLIFRVCGEKLAVAVTRTS